MQIIITISLLLVIATVIIYKVNDKFEKREFIILLATIFLLTIAFLYYENNDILQMLITKYYNDGLQKYGFDINKKMFNPTLFLKLLFGTYGTDLIQYAIDNFITCNKTTLYDYQNFIDKIISDIGDRIALI